MADQEKLGEGLRTINNIRFLFGCQSKPHLCGNYQSGMCCSQKYWEYTEPDTYYKTPGDPNFPRCASGQLADEES